MRATWASKRRTAAPLAIPGIGPIIAAGPIAAALAGAGIGAATGGLIGGLTDLGIPDEEAHTYAEGVRRGGTLVTATAHTEMQAARAVDILHRHGAVDIEERAASWRQDGWSGQVSDKEETIPLVKEEVAVGKRKVSKGAVKVYSRVQERPVQETVKLQDEKARIERRPVDRPASARRRCAIPCARPRWKSRAPRAATAATPGRSAACWRTRLTPA